MLKLELSVPSALRAIGETDGTGVLGCNPKRHNKKPLDEEHTCQLPKRAPKHPKGCWMKQHEPAPVSECERLALEERAATAPGWFAASRLHATLILRETLQET
jgi:hypothetical protein